MFIEYHLLQFLRSVSTDYQNLAITAHSEPATTPSACQHAHLSAASLRSVDTLAPKIPAV